MAPRFAPQTFPGSFEDDRGTEAVVWWFEPTVRYGPSDRRVEIHTVVRGVEVWGFQLDGLEPVESGQRRLTVNAAGDLDQCVLGGELPCTLEVDGSRRPTTVRFTLDLRIDEPKNLRLAADLDGVTVEVADDDFEQGLQRLEDSFPSGARLACCVTCLYSDYSPAGRDMIGIRCRREAKEQYLAVRSKRDYWSVPVTEEVPETYLCAEYERRVPGTGYRG
jgi:hypothetical protein